MALGWMEIGDGPCCGERLNKKQDEAMVRLGGPKGRYGRARGAYISWDAQGL